MSKNPRTLTGQEKKVAAFARNSISARATFHPDLWRSGSEPADLVCQVGRSLLFVNMTQSKSFMASMVAHNVDQARARIEEWQKGRQIRGKNDHRSFAIRWDEVDYIAVISVVDGPYAMCADHDISTLDFDPKVRLCSTVTSRIFYELAIRRGGARDLLYICKLMSGKGDITEDDASTLMVAAYNRLIAHYTNRSPSKPGRFGFALIDGKTVSAFEEARYAFELVRRDPSLDIERVADLCWADIFAAAKFRCTSTSEMEYLDGGQVRSSDFGLNTKFNVIISSNSAGLAELMPSLIERSDNADCAFMHVVSLTGAGPLSFFAHSPSKARWSIDADLELQDQNFLSNI